MRLKVTKKSVRKRKQQTPRSRNFLFWRAAGRRSGMRLAQRRRREHVLAVVLVSIISVFSFGFFSIISHDPRLEVRGMHITGARSLSPTALEAAATATLYKKVAWFSRTNIALYSKYEISHALREAFPRVKSVNISLEDRIMQIAITERVPHALWCRDGGGDCYFIDDEGVIFASAEGVIAQNTYTFSGGVVSEDPRGTTLLPAHFSRMSDLIHALEERGLSIAQVHILNDQDFEVRTEGGMAIRAGFAQDTDTIVGNAQTALASDVLRGRENELTYIDVRFGDRVYFKFGE